MSLDVYLKLPGQVKSAVSHIYIREDGQIKEITRAEWDARYLDKEPITVEVEGGDTVYSANITHNLGGMANIAGVYLALWRPEEIGATHAHQLIAPLREGLATLRDNPGYFEQYNPSNGWGSYDGLCRFIADYLAACEEYPSAEVSVSR